MTSMTRCLPRHLATSGSY